MGSQSKESQVSLLQIGSLKLLTGMPGQGEH